MAFGLEVYDAAGKDIFSVGRKYYKQIGAYTIPVLSNRPPYGQALDWYNSDFRHVMKVSAPIGGTVWARSSRGGASVASIEVEGSTIICYPMVDICSNGVCRTRPVKILWGVFQ